MRIDAHHHLWNLQSVDYPWLMDKGVRRFFGDPTPIQRNYLIEEYRQDAQASGFHGSVHIQVGAADGLAEAQWVQRVADANPDWPIAQVAFCDLAAPDAPKMLETLRHIPTVRGVRQIVGRAATEDQQTGSNALLKDPTFALQLRSPGELGLSFDLQLTPDLMPDMAELIGGAPRTAFALCHAGSLQDLSPSGLRDYQKRLSRLSALPNVWCKLSGFGMFDHAWTGASIAPIIDICFEQFGPDRLMFGSNFPVDGLYSDYRTIVKALEASLPDSAKDAVFGGTAHRFYFAGDQLSYAST